MRVYHYVEAIHIKPAVFKKTVQELVFFIFGYHVGQGLLNRFISNDWLPCLVTIFGYQQPNCELSYLITLFIGCFFGEFPEILLLEDILHHLECKKLNPVNDGKKTTNLNWFSRRISEPSAAALHKSGKHYLLTSWWFQIFCNFHPYLGKIPILTSIFFQMGGSTTNQIY